MRASFGRLLQTCRLLVCGMSIGSLLVATAGRSRELPRLVYKFIDTGRGVEAEVVTSPPMNCSVSAKTSTLTVRCMYPVHVVVAAAKPGEPVVSELKTHDGLSFLMPSLDAAQVHRTRDRIVIDFGPVSTGVNATAELTPLPKAPAFAGVSQALPGLPEPLVAVVDPPKSEAQPNQTLVPSREVHKLPVPELAPAVSLKQEGSVAEPGPISVAGGNS